MDARYLVLLLFCSKVTCEDCLTYSLEDGFNNTISNEVGLCIGFSNWIVGTYEEGPIDPPNSFTTKYIYPDINASCASSYFLSLEAAGTVEVNLYIDPHSVTDQVSILINQIVPDGNDAVVGSSFILASQSNLQRGWRSERVSLTGSGSYVGYVSSMNNNGTLSCKLFKSKFCRQIHIGFKLQQRI